MRWVSVGLVLAVAASVSGAGSAAARSPDREMAATAGHWLYVVKSRPSRQEREAEFNRWYDEIDVPDVLAVPGFDRARRAILRSALQAPEAGYAAFYDIRSADIDRSIIDLYVAARRMVQLGRDSDALRVTEANYYERVRSDELHGDIGTLIRTEVILCCADAESRAELLGWYDRSLVPALRDMAVVRRISLYELYRVMETVAVPEDEVPHFLLMLESGEASPAASVDGRADARASAALQEAGTGPFVRRKQLEYELMLDVSAER